MASSLLEQIVAGQAPALHCWTAEQYQQLTASGILPDAAPIELIDGLLVLKDRRDRGGSGMNHGVRHASVLRKLARWSGRFESLGLVLQLQLPVGISDLHVPEPDGAVLRGPAERYETRLPTAADVLLVMEVADSSLSFDMNTKLRLYATAGIPVYWILNLRDDQVEALERAIPEESRFESRRVWQRGEAASFFRDDLAALEIPVMDLLG